MDVGGLENCSCEGKGRFYSVASELSKFGIQPLCLFTHGDTAFCFARALDDDGNPCHTCCLEIDRWTLRFDCVAFTLSSGLQEHNNQFVSYMNGIVSNTSDNGPIGSLREWVFSEVWASTGDPASFPNMDRIAGAILRRFKEIPIFCDLLTLKNGSPV